MLTSERPTSCIALVEATSFIFVNSFKETMCMTGKNLVLNLLPFVIKSLDLYNGPIKASRGTPQMHEYAVIMSTYKRERKLRRENKLMKERERKSV